MKELSIEEKARAYDKALKVIKDNLNALNEIAETGAKIVNIQAIKNCFYRVFPELKESEDERIRKELLEHCKNQAEPYILTGNNCPQIQSWIAWLEKQGEQKPQRMVSAEAKETMYGKPAWSEEDEAMWAEISDLLWEGYKQSGSKFSWDDIRNWVNPKLKSLRPQKQWKPSEEQIKALNYVVNLMASSERPTENDLYYNILKSLRQQLKKLREE